MDYSIGYKKSVGKDLKRIDKANAKRILDRIDKELSSNPDRFPALSGPFSGMRKFRVGDYRVIFVIMEESVLILRIQDRKDEQETICHTHPTMTSCVRIGGG